MLATSQPEALTLVRGALCNGKSRIALNMSCVRRSVQATTAWRSRERRCGGILASASVRVGQQAEMDNGDCWELEFSPVETGLPPPNDRNYQDNSTHPR
ncbi:hypothetical protein CGCS363_v011880 [Colletotrichum siamense]|uniref:uncharacterized protein n=1 Tax=Colletotrichum siamense TaxID=690259 RepID=UPI001872855F|nr:uncharacterized protein CGCS363_v011880 [Colletotrichum siamense]KAF5489774.1 hypothetical protein CGCS363_v011880 [Colletotrichum siamense]